MSTASERRSTGSRGWRSPPAFGWTIWPVRHEPLRVLGLLVIGAALAGLVYWSTVRSHLAWLSLAAIILAEWKSFVPARYELNPKGLHFRFWRRRRVPWHAVRRCRLADDGFTILTDDQQPWKLLGALRVPWPKQKVEAQRVLEYYLSNRQARGTGSITIAGRVAERTTAGQKVTAPE